MKRRVFALVAAAVVAILPYGVQAQAPRNHDYRGRRLLRPFYRPPPARILRLPPLLIAPPNRFLPPPVGRPSPLEEDQLQAPAPFSHGFHLTVPMGGVPHAAPPHLERAFEVGTALGACWVPPADMPWKIITIRLSFKNDGSVNGEPRVPFKDAGSPQQNSDLANSLLAALKHCTPLPFSPALGSAIAGEIFAISFIHQDQR